MTFCMNVWRGHPHVWPALNKPAVWRGSDEEQLSRSICFTKTLKALWTEGRLQAEEMAPKKSARIMGRSMQRTV